mgnify:CR=1 FL=1
MLFKNKKMSRIVALLLTAALSFSTNSFVFAGENSSSVLLGDVNGDGIVNSDDASLALSYVLKPNEVQGFNADVADVNGNDVTLKVGEHVLKVPASKKQALIDGGYDGKTVVLGIRPEHVSDEQMAIASHPESVIEGDITVYELLGAEVYLYFDIEGFHLTARVNPRTTARTGDKVKFALDMEKIHVFDKETELVIAN